jgi:hypothetical protein
MEPSARTDQAVSANQVLLMVKGHDHLDPGPGRVLDDVGQVRALNIDASSMTARSPGPRLTGPSAPRRPVRAGESCGAMRQDQSPGPVPGYAFRSSIGYRGC